MTKALLIIAAAMALAGPALAQQTASPPSKLPDTSALTDSAATAKSFADVDTDKNGSISLAELKMLDLSVTQAQFDKYDTDKSKSLSKAEFDKFMADHQKPAPAKAG